jgi:hypothetical protein
MLVAEVLHILDVLEKQHLIERTYAANDHTTVAAIIHDLREVKCLLEDKDTNFPLMLARYQEEKVSMTDEMRLIYFIIFRLYHDDAAIPELVSYLVSCRTVVPREKLKFFSPWNPFFHAVHALATLSYHQTRIPTGSEVLNNLDTFLQDIVQWNISRFKRQRKLP